MKAGFPLFLEKNLCGPTNRAIIQYPFHSCFCKRVCYVGAISSMQVISVTFMKTFTLIIFQNRGV